MQAVTRNRAEKYLRYAATTVMFVALVLAFYVMVNGLGLAESLDFGAGAYYYADMPGFERWSNRTFYVSPVPMWVLIVLFLAWGTLMYRAWSALNHWLDVGVQKGEHDADYGGWGA